MAKTIEERAARDLELQRLLGDFICEAPKVKPGWVFISPAVSKTMFMKILKMYPEVKS